MTWIAAIIVGAFVGWVASLIMKTDEQMGALANILVGIVGALLGRFLFANILNLESAATAGSFSLLGVLWGLVGAVILIAVLKFFGVMGRSNV